MATIRLVPSTTAVNNESYASIANANNMYTNTDSTTYGTFTHNRASTNSTYYGYIRGFNFSAVPTDATVSSFTVKIKASATGHTTSTSSSYYMSLINNTTQIGSTTASGRLSTTVTTFTFSNGSLDWGTIKTYGANFGIRIPMRRANSNTADVVSVYGAEIEVTYTIPVYHNVTTSLTGSGTIEPSGTESYLEGEEYNLVVTPTNQSDAVTATKNGSSITLTQHTGGETSDSNVLGTYHLVSGGFNSGASWFEGRVGQGYDTTSTTTSNYYSSSSSVNAVFQYNVAFADVPSNATIKSLYMMANGHAESTSNSSEYMCVQLKSGSTALSTQYNFKSAGTSNSTQTINATTLPTPEQLADLVVECTLGYYGGAINGVTVFLTYEVSGVYYTYSTTVDSDMTIVVTIGGGGSQPKIYIKINNTWTQYSKVYKKVNGSWVEQTSSTWATLFNTNTNYRKME